MTTKYGIYGRVSPLAFDVGARRNEQVRTCKLYGRKRHWQLHAGFLDVAVVDDNRPGLRALITAAHSPTKPMKHIVACQWDRLFREENALSRFKQSLAKHGVTVHAVSAEAGEPDSPDEIRERMKTLAQAHRHQECVRRRPRKKPTQKARGRP